MIPLSVLDYEDQGRSTIAARSLLTMLVGKMTYKIELPLIVTYENENQANSAHLMVTVLIVREIETSHPDGIAIDQINAPTGSTRPSKPIVQMVFGVAVMNVHSIASTLMSYFS